MTREQWAEGVIRKQPVFDSKDKAIRAALQANRKGDVKEVFQEPANRGGRYLVAAPEAFEALVDMKYKRVADACMLADIQRGDHIDDIEEA